MSMLLDPCSPGLYVGLVLLEDVLGVVVLGVLLLLQLLVLLGVLVPPGLLGLLEKALVAETEGSTGGRLRSMSACICRKIWRASVLSSMTSRLTWACLSWMSTAQYSPPITSKPIIMATMISSSV